VHDLFRLAPLPVREGLGWPRGYSQPWLTYGEAERLFGLMVRATRS